MENNRDTNRRDFLRSTAGLMAATGLAGCLDSDEDLKSFHLSTDLDRMDEEVDGHELYVNVYSHAESGEEDIQKMTLEYNEPGEDVWNVLETEQAKNGEASIESNYDPEELGVHSFRSIAYTEDSQYVSDTEEVEVV